MDPPHDPPIEQDEQSPFSNSTISIFSPFTLISHLLLADIFKESNVSVNSCSDCSSVSVTDEGEEVTVTPPPDEDVAEAETSNSSHSSEAVNDTLTLTID